MASLLSLNVRGLRNEKKRRIIFKYVRERADLILLQETHSDKKTEKIWESEWGGKILFNHGDTDSRGVCVLFSKKFKGKILKTQRDSEGRFIKVLLKIDNMDFVVVNVYGPNKDRPSFIQSVFEQIGELSENIIVMGDYNLTINPNMDRLNTETNNEKAKEALLNLMEELILCDIWRERNPESKTYSWFSHRKNGISKASRIDNLIVSKGCAAKLDNIIYIPGVMTDHSAMYICLSTSKNERGKGYWKFNNTLLQEPEFITYLNNQIEKEIAAADQMEADQRWDYLKKKIKVHSQRWTRTEGSKRKLIISQLLEHISDLENCMPLDYENTVLLEASKQDLNDLLEQQIQGVMFRTKSKWYEEGEKNTRYFYNLEKSKYNAKTCQSLLCGDTVITDDEQILEKQREFYQNLYTEDEEVSFTLQNNTDVSLSEEQAKEISHDLQEHEFRSALKQLKNNKTPGNDGLTADFYKVFWGKIGDYMLTAIETALQKEQLHKTALQGILNVIPKPGRDSRILTNLRPITLLNVDYKLLEKVIANRIQPYLEKLINADQTGFMQNRRIAVNIRKMYDIMHILEERDEEGIVLNLDFRKAFDEISFTAIKGALIYFGFPKNIITWTKILYKNFKVRVQNNRKFSNWINIERVVHQGRCCSTTYFLLCAEILAIELRGNSQVKGLPVGNIIALLDQFADDLDVFSEFSQSSLENTLNTLERCRTQIQSIFLRKYLKHLGKIQDT